jgi:hypothetical protein
VFAECDVRPALLGATDGNDGGGFARTYEIAQFRPGEIFEVDSGWKRLGGRMNLANRANQYDEYQRNQRTPFHVPNRPKGRVPKKDAVSARWNRDVYENS